MKRQRAVKPERLDRELPSNQERKISKAKHLTSKRRNDEVSSQPVVKPGSNSDDATVDEAPLLTPHTLRLLKLIQDGSQEHASMAALQLKTITQQSSPLVLWDVLGRLQLFLVAPSWQTRTNASTAMQNVARHLPPQSQRQFMEGDLSTAASRKTEGSDNEKCESSSAKAASTSTKDYLWLTLDNVEKELQIILQQGRLLWAYAEPDQDSATLQAEDYVLYLDQQHLESHEQNTTTDEDHKEFLQRRIEYQRRILAQRVGLSGLIQAVGKGKDIMEAITSEDLTYIPTFSNPPGYRSEPKPPKRKRRRKPRGNRAEDEDNVDETSKEFRNAQSVRALLVMEMKREQSASADTMTPVSHNNPQSLLATELLYRVFDASWYVRHGALLGLLSLLRAWYTPSKNSTEMLFGAWPEDIMARCLCILVLDRFGDYSGTTTAAMGGSESGCVVAPVRETAGQLLAMVWRFAPASVQASTLQLLSQLATVKITSDTPVGDAEDRTSDWEIRHGALLALKYIVVIHMTDNTGSTNNSHTLQSTKISEVATKCLADTSDDVQSVSAQILSTLLTFTDGVHDREKMLRQLWKALAVAKSMSSSILDLMNLCSTLLQHQRDAQCILFSQGNGSGGISGSKVLGIFREYLDHDLMSVRLAALRSITASVLPLWRAEAETCSCEALTQALDQILERLFVSYWGPKEANEEEREAMNKNEDISANDDFKLCCSQAWTSLVAVLCDRLKYEQHKRSFEAITIRLVRRFFGIAAPNQVGDLSIIVDPKDAFDCQVSASDALSDLLWESVSESHEAHLHDRGDIAFLEVAIRSFVHSPWTVQCQAACLLLRALLKRGGGGHGKTGDEPINQALKLCKKEVVAYLTTQNTDAPPLCLAVEVIVGGDLFAMGLRQLQGSAFQEGVKLLIGNDDAETRIQNAIILIRDLWRNSLFLKDINEKICGITLGDVATNTSSMQLFATMAGVSLAGCNGIFPLSRVTPIARPLMTSLKNETDPSRLQETSGYMAELLLLLFTVGNSAEDAALFAKPWSKILGTMCDRIGSSQTDEHDFVRIAFTETIQKYFKALAGQIESLALIEPVRERLQPLLDKNQTVLPALNLLEVVCGDLPSNSAFSFSILWDFVPPITELACQNTHKEVDGRCADIIKLLCSNHTDATLRACLPGVTTYLEDRTNDSSRLAACKLLEQIVHTVGIAICPFVRQLLRIVMSLMADPVSECAKTATSTFASLVRVAPLVQSEHLGTVDICKNGKVQADSVLDHLIHGKPLPPLDLPEEVSAALAKAGVSLRPYQIEGIAWLQFLQSVRLNGALCDSMGLGKTLQALIGIAITHVDRDTCTTDEPHSLVVCPSSVVGHWAAEIEKFFPGQSIFRSLSYIGTETERKALWKCAFTKCNIVVTSYSVLRSDADTLSKHMWRFVILDEGHLLKNPKTATARASRRLRAHHKLILTGTPVQNKVQEVFATFDFLMPNFLGNSQAFAKEFARHITKGHLPGASAESINAGMEKLKILHQQVLPFILRREKSQVLKELPPKVVSTVPCDMSDFQRTLYDKFLMTQDARDSVEELQRVLQQSPSPLSEPATTPANSIGSKALKILLYLRLVCTHPSLVQHDSVTGTLRCHRKLKAKGETDVYDMSLSGKFLALAELLRASGIHRDEITGADNDTSLLYCNQDEGDKESSSELSRLLNPMEDDGGLTTASTEDDGSKCLVFAQFTNSLDAVEELLFKRHMPSLRYLRLDGRVPATKRTALVDAFNNDHSIRVMLLTTRVGGLGLNLTGADTVIFLENDYNPFADLQAADRAHRIGQAKTVNVYRLVTKESIEEKIMSLQEKKIALSDAIVNTDNSTLFSMGTDRLLDIFTCRSDNQQNKGENGSASDASCNLDALVESYKSEYSALSVNDFLRVLQQ